MRPEPEAGPRSGGRCHVAGLPDARVPLACDNSQNRLGGAPESASSRLFRLANERPAQQERPPPLLRRVAPRPEDQTIRARPASVRIRSPSYSHLRLGVRVLSFAPNPLFRSFIRVLQCSLDAMSLTEDQPQLDVADVRKDLAAADGFAEGARHIRHGRYGAFVLHAHGPQHPQGALALIAHHIWSGNQ